MTDYSYGEFLSRDMRSDSEAWNESHSASLVNSWQHTFGTPYSLLARVSNFNLGNGSSQTLLDMTGVKAVVAPCLIRLQMFNVSTRTSGTHKLRVEVQDGGTLNRIMNEIDLVKDDRYLQDDLSNFYMAVHSRNDNISLPTTSGEELIENVGSWPITPPDWGTRSSTQKCDSAYRGYAYPTKLVFDVDAVNQDIDPSSVYRYQSFQSVGTKVQLRAEVPSDQSINFVTAELYGCGMSEFF